MLETSSVSQILSSVTSIANINSGYTVTTTTHEQDAKGTITSYQTTYTVYDKTAALVKDSTPRYVDTSV